jgi:flagellin
MVINTNISAMSGSRLLAESSNLLRKSLSRLSSGSKIVSPEDDVAGQAVATRFDAQINRISAASKNVSNAISFAQTQDGFLQKVAKALDRMSELAILAQDVTKNTNDLALYDTEYQTLGDYIDDLATKNFNSITLFDGVTLSVTVDSDANTYSMTGVDLSGAGYTTATAGSDITSAANAATALTNVKDAIEQLTRDRANVGANIGVLTNYTSQLNVLKENLSAANSRIKDVDVAEESTQYARYNILVQSGTAMLAQANQLPQNVLRLIQQ